jgi:hypothetical protein
MKIRDSSRVFGFLFYDAYNNDNHDYTDADTEDDPPAGIKKIAPFLFIKEPGAMTKY